MPTTTQPPDHARPNERSISSSPSRPERLAGLDLLSECGPGDRRIVARHLEIMEIPAGTMLLRAGDPATNVFFVLDGELEVRSRVRDEVVRSGRHVGEIALLRGVATSDDVVTATDCVVGVLGARMFHVLSRDLPPFTRALLRDLAARATDPTPCGSSHPPPELGFRTPESKGPP